MSSVVFDTAGTGAGSGVAGSSFLHEVIKKARAAAVRTYLCMAIIEIGVGVGYKESSVQLSVL